jgi:hypothetical protein
MFLKLVNLKKLYSTYSLGKFDVSLIFLYFTFKGSAKVVGSLDFLVLENRVPILKFLLAMLLLVASLHYSLE